MVHNPKLKTKLQELKLRAGHVNYMNVDLTERGNRVTEDYFRNKLDERIICGYAIAWNKKNLANEKVVKGAADKSTKERGPASKAQYKITFLWMHKQDDPLALIAKLESDDYGLYFETAPLDDVPSADRALKQIRSKTLNQFSIGFDYVWDKVEYDETDDSIVLLEINLFEISLVSIGMDQNTFACRSLEQFNNLFDEIEDFVLTLPRKDRATARELFTRQKALIDIEPFKKEDIPEPLLETRGIDYEFLSKNFKI